MGMCPGVGLGLLYVCRPNQCSYVELIVLCCYCFCSLFITGETLSAMKYERVLEKRIAYFSGQLSVLCVGLINNSVHVIRDVYTVLLSCIEGIILCEEGTYY